MPFPWFERRVWGRVGVALVALTLLGRGALADDARPADATRMRVDRWGMESGLRQATVTSVALDDRGELWVGTFGGLHRFTGSGFVPVGMPPEQQARLARVTALQADAGGLWVGFLGEGLRWFDGARFSKFDVPDVVEHAKVRGLSLDQEGALWVAFERGLWKRSADGDWSMVLDDQALGVFVADDDTVLVATTEGLVVIEANGRTTRMLEDEPIYGVAADPDGNVWIQGLHRLWVWPARGDAPVRTAWEEACPFGVGPAFDDNGHVWLPTRAGVVDIGHWRSALSDMLLGEVPQHMKVSTDAVPRALVVDPNGQRWVGTMGGGMVRISELSYTRYPMPPGVGTIALGPVASAADGVVVAVDCSRLAWLSDAGVESITDLPADLPGGTRCIRGMAVDADGGVWFGWPGMLFGPDGDAWRRISLPGPPLHPEDEVHTLVFDAEQRLWVGTGDGRAFVRSSDGVVEEVQLPEGAGQPLTFEFYEDRTFVGTTEGLAVLVEGEAPEMWWPEDGLPYGPVRDIAVDWTGVVWMVTYGGGLGWLDGEDAGRLGMDVPGMPDGFLSTVVPDPDGGLWLHGNRGLHYIRRADLDVARRSDRPSLVSRRFDIGGANGWNRPAGWVDPAGALWAVTLDSVVRFPFAADQAPEVPGLARILDVQARDARFEAGDQAVTIPSRLGRSIVVHFAAPPLGPDLRPSFRYRLVSAAEPAPQWSVPSPDVRAKFAQLAPGEYFVEVQAVGLNGTVGPVDSVEVHIPKYWHERATVWLLLFWLLSLAVTVVFGARLFSLGDQNRRLQEQIRQRRVAEARAQLRERHYRELFEAAGHGLLLFSVEGLCTDANAEAERIFRTNAEELVGMTRARLGLDASTLHRIQCRRPDGSQFPARVATARHVERGETRVLVSVVDLTELLEAREAERHLRGQLESARRIESLGRLAGGVAHDMNNLLAAIIGNAELMQEENRDAASGGPVDPYLAEGLDEILDASARGARLIEQLMSMGRRDNSPPGDIPLDETLSAMESMLRRIVPDDVVLTVQAQTHLAVRGTRAALEQVVLNLVMNAADAMGHGGALDVTARALPGGEVVELAVRDTGDGIPEDIQSTIFEPFVTSKAPGEGTGLGLATVRDVVTQMGGTISVRSVLGEGSTFTVHLPAVQVLPKTASHASDQADGAELWGQRVLVVDDNDALRRTVVSALRGRGFSVVDYGDPVEAHAWTRRSKPALDVLVTDVVMPGLDGRSLADKVREAYPSLPVLFISGYTGDVVVRHGVDTEREALLRKPFSRDDLLSALDALLRVAQVGAGPG